jgi:hypothetical protein
LIIVKKRRRGRGHQYLVRWRGYGPEADVWVPATELEDTQHLQDYNASLTKSNEDNVSPIEDNVSPIEDNAKPDEDCEA